ncbi:RNA-directed DNA polymerase protein [Dioscorea alata]|uniref:RNA-directed DNA polymerase protein n=1 Tax=Dioscorea alata TaxID=55571 RepID=A0ACB7WTH9_DIOAL|nr:RNA-directed DNA polymerase protein [Dioscorea alata]
MNIVSWNVRGLGRPAKRYLVKDFLNLHFADICCLQESKLEIITENIWRDIGGARLDQFESLPVKGSTGGIIMGWNSGAHSGKLIKVGTFSLTMEFHSKRDNFSWRCTSVYGPNGRSLKPAFWEELRDCGGDQAFPWVICGDFNAIFTLEDKNSSNLNFDDI